MKRRHPLIPLVLWLAVFALSLLAVLVYVVAQLDTSDARLDAAHLQGMEVGQQMCLGFRPEAERGPRAAAMPVRPRDGGLL